ncbi:hypothetical protein PFFCH_02090 [Plasmodium falciparum FCH/4]|uniref:Uncharacterized protein n=1 Tax=Plasmodium falciparum FCH/4 TaxID=1036724 RepID=A0A024VRE6_PLAFA|nr:hypothetical protein PFFCH_02090 [Plasmodium falciparum FCH/4]
MFRKDIKKIYLKNHLKKIYIVKRQNENNIIEEKKSSVLYKDFKEFILVLINIRKYEKALKKLKGNKASCEFSKVLQEYLDFYLSTFGYKFHTFILEYKTGDEINDPNNCYVINKLRKSDIEKIVNKEYSRILFKYDSIKYVLYYIKKHTLLFQTFNCHFKKLLINYLFVTLNPLNVLIFVYLKLYQNNDKTNVVSKSDDKDKIKNKDKSDEEMNDIPLCENKNICENNNENYSENHNEY